MRRLLVTGSSGFLGGYIGRHFSERGWEVLGIDQKPPFIGATWNHETCNVESVAFKEIISNFQPEGVVHAAGGASVPQAMASPLKDFESGPQLVMQLLDALNNATPRARVVFLSSAAVYGQPHCLPIGENAACVPISPYGFHKWMSELACREYALFKDQPAAIARIFSAYGPGLQKQVVWDLCRKANDCSREFRLQGTGAESRDFIHAQDVARAVECVLEHAPMRGEVYNVASGNETTIRELADMVICSLNDSLRAVFDGNVPRGTPSNWRAEISKIRALGFEPQISLAHGIKGTVDWFKTLLPEDIHVNP